jgi:hypothetical protein
MKNILVAAGLFFSTFLVADEVLYCVPDLSTGFIYKNNSFNTENFKVPRFSMKVNGDFESIQIGDWKYSCKEGDLDKIYFCDDIYDIGYSFKFNKENGRFINAYLAGYGYLSHSSTKKNKHDTDSITAGKCDDF